MEENNKSSPAVRSKRRNKPNNASAHPTAVSKPNVNRRTGTGTNWNNVSKSTATANAGPENKTPVVTKSNSNRRNGGAYWNNASKSTTTAIAGLENTPTAVTKSNANRRTGSGANWTNVSKSIITTIAGLENTPTAVTKSNANRRTGAGAGSNWNNVSKSTATTIAGLENTPTAVSKSNANRRTGAGSNWSNLSKSTATTIAGSENKTTAASRPNANRRTGGTHWNNASKGTATTIAGPENKITAVSKPKAKGRSAKSKWNNVSKSMEGKNLTTSDCNQNQKNQNAQGLQKKRFNKSKFVAMDCEMVGVGSRGQFDMVARVSIVNRNGKVLMDKYVKPRDDITDYRTAISGIRPCNLVNAEEFDAVQDEVLQLLENRVLVGHNVRKDLQVLHITHPFTKTRDTSTYKPLSLLVSNGRTPSLKLLSQSILGLQIQNGEHSSVEDARAVMSVYNRLAADWEQYLRINGYNTNKRRR